MNPSLIRNFAIIAHIDHGKSTLADRFLELTGTVERRRLVSQTLDTHPISRERGITIRLAPVTMKYQSYTLNLIDTPGHVDFSYEVERSLAACEGAVLLVDATQGIQAQTLSHFEKAKKLGLQIIPAVNKIDSPNARIDESISELAELVGVDKSQVHQVSAKTGQNVPELLKAVISRIPPPAGPTNAPVKTMVFSSTYNRERGVVAFVKILAGKLEGHVGHFSPEMVPCPVLETGEVGYLLTGVKDPEKVSLWEGYQPPKPMVFVSLFPVNQDDFPLLEDALKKLRLNDAAVSFSPTGSRALGRGFRCGFLGHLHAEIGEERLEEDFGLSLLATTPTVEYHQSSEPWVKATIIVPQTYLGNVLTLCDDHRGQLLNLDYHPSRVTLTYELPLAEIITDFFDRMKAVSAGYASLDYELTGYRPAALVRLDVIINHEAIDAFSLTLEKSRAEKYGRFLVSRLKEVIPRQQIPIPIQAAIDGQIIARQDISAYRKDVTAKLYGGDVTRRMKLLEKQKKGKEKMKQIGKVAIPSDTFLKVFRT